MATRKSATAKIETKAKNTAVVSKLATNAKEINARLEKAQLIDTKADDHRLAAALKLEEAKRTCEASGVNFKKWVEENIKYSYENVRKLVTVAQSSEPAKALADMRARQAGLMRKSRAKAKAARQQQQPVSREPKVREAAPTEVISEELARMDDVDAVEVLRSQAQAHGMVLMSEAEAKKNRRAVGLEAFKNAFNALSADDKFAFVTWAAKEMGRTLADPFASADPFDIPAKLKRTAA